jgi:O-succinylbenzoic acid--CoA ligase
VDAAATIDLAAVVPMQLEAMLARPERLACVRQLIIGGAPLSPTLEERLQGVATACYATYGMTETVSHVALRRVNGPLASPYYTALGETHFEMDGRGCLVVHAPHLRQGCFVTNDLVRLLDGTRFEWLGRADHVINSGGVKISPERLEARLAPLISRRFFVAAEPDERLGQRVVLVVEGEPWGEEERARFTAHAARLLDPYERPRSLRFLPVFRETSSGKVLRVLV